VILFSAYFYLQFEVSPISDMAKVDFLGYFEIFSEPHLVSLLEAKNGVENCYIQCAIC
jgi:hypothetical protein